MTKWGYGIKWVSSGLKWGWPSTSRARAQKTWRCNQTNRVRTGCVAAIKAG